MTMRFEDAFTPAERLELADTAERTVSEVDRGSAERLVYGFRPIRGLRAYGWAVGIAASAFLTITSSTPRHGLIIVGAIALGALAAPALALYGHAYYRAFTAYRDSVALQDAYALPLVASRLIANAPRLRNEEWPTCATNATRVMKVRLHRALDGLSFYAIRFPDGVVVLRTMNGTEPRTEIDRLREIDSWTTAKMRLGLEALPEAESDSLS